MWLSSSSNNEIFLATGRKMLDATQDLVLGPTRILVKCDQTIYGIHDMHFLGVRQLFVRSCNAWTTSAVTSLWYDELNPILTGHMKPLRNPSVFSSPLPLGTKAS